MTVKELLIRMIRQQNEMVASINRLHKRIDDIESRRFINPVDIQPINPGYVIAIYSVMTDGAG